MRKKIKFVLVSFILILGIFSISTTAFAEAIISSENVSVTEVIDTSSYDEGKRDVEDSTKELSIFLIIFLVFLCSLMFFSLVYDISEISKIQKKIDTIKEETKTKSYLYDLLLTDYTNFVHNEFRKINNFLIYLCIIARKKIGRKIYKLNRYYEINKHFEKVTLIRAKAYARHREATFSRFNHTWFICGIGF